MLNVIKCSPHHLAVLHVQRMQEHAAPSTWEPGHAERLCSLGQSFAIFADTHLIACAGLAPLGAHRALAWAILGADARKHMLSLTRLVKSYLNKQPYTRIETTVEWGFGPGHRWAYLLGFTYESRMVAYAPDGKDHSMFVRINRG